MQSDVFNFDLDSDKTTKKSQDVSSHQFQKDKSKSRDEALLSAQHVSDFLSAFTCYELMPQSSKVVVLDTNVTVSVAMQALDENGRLRLLIQLFNFLKNDNFSLDIHSALLWDSKESDFVGMISVTDFLHFVFQSYTANPTQDLTQTLVLLEKMKLRTCRGSNSNIYIFHILSFHYSKKLNDLTFVRTECFKKTTTTDLCRSTRHSL
jgi:hypothetical protein